MKGHSKELSSPPGMESSTIVFVRLSKRTTCIAGHLTKSLTRKHIIYKTDKNIICCATMFSKHTQI